MPVFCLAVNQVHEVNGELYYIHSRLGGGAFGQVYQASKVLSDERLDVCCALKVTLFRDLAQRKITTLKDNNVEINYTSCVEGHGAQPGDFERLVLRETEFLNIQDPKHPTESFFCSMPARDGAGREIRVPVGISVMPYRGDKNIASCFLNTNPTGNVISTKIHFHVGEASAESFNEIEKTLGRQATQLVPKLMLNLVDLHSKGLVHRDIKPLNIALDDSNPYIVDLGTAIKVSDVVLGNTKKCATREYRTPYAKWGDRLGEPEIKSKGGFRHWSGVQNHTQSADINAMGYTILDMFGFDVYKEINAYIKRQKKAAKQMIAESKLPDVVEEVRQDCFTEVQRRITHFIDHQVMALLPARLREESHRPHAEAFCEILKGMTVVDDGKRFTTGQLKLAAEYMQAVLSAKSLGSLAVPNFSSRLGSGAGAGSGAAPHAALSGFSGMSASGDFSMEGPSDAAPITCSA